MHTRGRCGAVGRTLGAAVEPWGAVKEVESSEGSIVDTARSAEGRGEEQQMGEQRFWGAQGALAEKLGKAGIEGRGGCAKCSREVLVTKNSPGRREGGLGRVASVV